MAARERGRCVLVLHVFHGAGYERERVYAARVMFEEFLGLEIVLHAGHEAGWRIVRGEEEDGKELRLADVLFRTPQGEWLTEKAMPSRPVPRWHTGGHPVKAPLVAPDVPVLYGEEVPNGGYLAVWDGGLQIGADLLGGAFWMLTRYEEIVRKERDVRGRYPAFASLAVQEHFYERPVVNEYLEILWWALHALWPDLERKKRRFTPRLSHDVDWPLMGAGRPFFQTVRRAAGDALRRRSAQAAVRRLGGWWRAAAHGDYDGDPYNTFDHLMEWSEQQGLRSAFYLIADHSGAGEVDGDYSLEEPWVRRLMRRIKERGHEIGLHPSYETYRDPRRLRREFDRLRLVCAEEGIEQERWGGRQHFLRWEAPGTWQAWEEAGLDYDSTLSFAERPGFRCGVCYEYPVFNLLTREELNLRERPLIVMEQTVLHRQYLGLDPWEAWVLIDRLRTRCRLFDGEFSMLWHNSQLVDQGETDLYRRLVETM